MTVELLVLVALLAAASAHVAPLLPKDWRRLRVAPESVATEVTNYLLSYAYPNSESCGGEAQTVDGIGFGVCFVDELFGQAYRYVYTKHTSDTVYYTSQQFPGTNCSTTPSYSYAEVEKMECINGAKFGTIKIGYAEGANSWKSVNKGVVSLTYFSPSTCNQNPAQWTSTSFSYCYWGPSYKDPEQGQYIKYTKCSGSVATVGYYKDNFCQVVESTHAQPATTCLPSTEVAGSWNSITCNN